MTAWSLSRVPPHHTEAPIATVVFPLRIVLLLNHSTIVVTMPNAKCNTSGFSFSVKGSRV